MLPNDRATATESKLEPKQALRQFVNGRLRLAKKGRLRKKLQSFGR